MSKSELVVAFEGLSQKILGSLYMFSPREGRGLLHRLSSELHSAKAELVEQCARITASIAWSEKTMEESAQERAKLQAALVEERQAQIQIISQTLETMHPANEIARGLLTQTLEKLCAMPVPRPDAETLANFDNLRQQSLEGLARMRGMLAVNLDSIQHLDVLLKTAAREERIFLVRYATELSANN